LKSLTTDHEVIKNAVKKSAELLELNEDGSKIRRKIQIKPKSDEVIERSIYVVCFCFIFIIKFRKILNIYYKK